MADYHPLILRAVEGLDKNTGDNRRALYERARIALVSQLRGVQPALDESEITRERLNDEVINLFGRQRFAGLFITHSISEAVFLSTRVLVMSARPGRIVAEFNIPFEYPRVPDLRFDPEFARLSGEISHELRGAHS